MQDILQFPKVVILTYDMEKVKLKYFALCFQLYTWEVGCCNVYLYIPLTSVLTNLVLKNAWIYDIGPGPCMTVLKFSLKCMDYSQIAQLAIN